MLITRVVSGGQTGADRAALDVALLLGLPYGGWCPPGGWAEDLTSPPGLLARYPDLEEAPPGPRSTRTLWNVRDSDATLVLGDPDRSAGSLFTVEAATELGRPLLVSPATDPAPVVAWLAALGGPLTLNVAGPRESEEPGVYDAVYRTLTSAWSC